jgi:hypothetical protein
MQFKHPLNITAAELLFFPSPQRDEKRGKTLKKKYKRQHAKKNCKHQSDIDLLFTQKTTKSKDYSLDLFQ